jgi:hypothetical protein
MLTEGMQLTPLVITAITAAAIHLQTQCDKRDQGMPHHARLHPPPLTPMCSSSPPGQSTRERIMRPSSMVNFSACILDL